MEKVGTRLNWKLPWQSPFLLYPCPCLPAPSICKPLPGGIFLAYWGPRKAVNFTFLEATFNQQETDCEQAPNFLTPWERNCNVFFPAVEGPQQD